MTTRLLPASVLGAMAAGLAYKFRGSALLSLAFVATGLSSSFGAARVTSDLPPPQKRALAVTNAERLSQRKPPGPLPGDLVSPFNPPGFDKPEQVEQPVAAPTVASGVPTPPPPPAGARETLEKLAGQIVPSGTIQLGGKQRLIINGKSFEVGTRFTATYNSEDYELELVAIDRTTFTLRYRGEEITRPIKPVR